MCPGSARFQLQKLELQSFRFFIFKMRLNKWFVTLTGLDSFEYTMKAIEAQKRSTISQFLGPWTQVGSKESDEV